ncbi:hypothetical protein [Parasitella parasitica]|uniref:Uncharacterized protein n=1 Tax=Parasitella parasitica TaxID=35722 RepID=A0A0B7NKR0_9FUNG|nr:hypothetical protein [Parasitella parasitica]
MNKGQCYEDDSLEQLQYQISAVYRPLDILSQESTTSEVVNTNMVRYCKLFRDIRRLLVHGSTSMTRARNKITLRAINFSFSLKTSNEVTYTLPLEKF